MCTHLILQAVITVVIQNVCMNNSLLVNKSWEERPRISFAVWLFYSVHQYIINRNYLLPNCIHFSKCLGKLNPCWGTSYQCSENPVLFYIGRTQLFSWSIFLFEHFIWVSWRISKELLRISKELIWTFHQWMIHNLCCWVSIISLSHLFDYVGFIVNVFHPIQCP